MPAVSDVTFGLHAGEVLGCLGTNGAGKSTIVKMLTGLSEPTRGQVLSFGASIHKDLVAYRRRLGYVPEEPELYAYLSGWEYLEMVGTLRGMERAQMTKKIDALLALLSLAPYRHSSIGSCRPVRLPPVVFGSCKRANMPQPDYMIYEISPDGSSVWMGNANNLQAARIRVTELDQRSLESFAVYDLRSPARAVFELKQQLGLADVGKVTPVERVKRD